MFTPDFSKMFDTNQYAQQYSQNLQKMWDWSNSFSTSQSNVKQGMEVLQQVNSIMTQTLSTCTEKQFKYAQSTMEDCVETMRELSTAKGMEEYVSKQTEISKRYAEKAQNVAQEIASTWQKSQSQCTDIISQQLSQQMEWSKDWNKNSNPSTKPSSSK